VVYGRVSWGGCQWLSNGLAGGEPVGRK
jgi:hypothetical protein